jgi:hypothetical protein
VKASSEGWQAKGRVRFVHNCCLWRKNIFFFKHEAMTKAFILCTFSAKPHNTLFVKGKNGGKVTLYIPIPKWVVAECALWTVVKHGVPNSKQSLTSTLTASLKCGILGLCIGMDKVS